MLAVVPPLFLDGEAVGPRERTWPGTWFTVFSTDAGKGGVEAAVFTPTTARFVRLFATQRSTGYGYSAYEFGVFAS